MNESTYKICREFSGQTTPSMDVEDTIGFVFDNYSLAIDMYRTIVKVQGEIEGIRKKAHEDLQKLRDNEEKWKRLGNCPKDFDAEEHQKRKEYLTNLREEEFEILYWGEPVHQDILGNLILRNMKIFGMMEHLDSTTRNSFGFCAEKAVKVAIWPTMKLLKIDIKNSREGTYKEKAEKLYKTIESAPEKVKNFFANT